MAMCLGALIGIAIAFFIQKVLMPRWLLKAEIEMKAKLNLPPDWDFPVSGFGHTASTKPTQHPSSLSMTL
jgi:hypothetical protein